jgi:hypothetical protein
MEPSAISHPHKNPLFLVIEESGVELGDDFLIPVVPKLEQISDTMQSQASSTLFKCMSFLFLMYSISTYCSLTTGDDFEYNTVRYQF